MKVNIGPFLTWWGPYQLADLLQKVGVSEDRCHSIGKWLAETWVADVCQWIDDKRSRTIKVKIHKYDCWNADGTFALIAEPLLRAFVEQGIRGVPIMLDYEDYGPYADRIKQGEESNCGLSDTELPAEEVEFLWSVKVNVWWAVLQSMIYAFHQINNDEWEMKLYDDFTVHGDSKRWFAEIKQEQERIDQGLLYFGKYMRAIWN